MIHKLPYRLGLTLILTAILLAGTLIAFRQASAQRVIPVQAWGTTTGVSYSDEVNLMARLVAAEASNEPYAGQVAVAAVILNRLQSPRFPKTISGVIYEPGAFESVSNGQIWQVTDLNTARQAVYDALSGWDPTFGALFFWNPYKLVNPWIWTRNIVLQIGRHVFAR